jgi:hypothetical protein
MYIWGATRRCVMPKELLRGRVEQEEERQMCDVVVAC